MSRRVADEAIRSGRIRVGNNGGGIGQTVDENIDQVYLDGQLLVPFVHTTILFNKPVGYVTSRDGQGSKTIYDLLPPKLHHLKPVGRLDKDSSGLILLTNDGKLAAELTHPSHQKKKVYEVGLDQPLSELHRLAIEAGVELDDGISRFKIQQLTNNKLVITMREGRNRQIRRTFEALGYTVAHLHRTTFGPYKLRNLSPGNYEKVPMQSRSI